MPNIITTFRKFDMYYQHAYDAHSKNVPPHIHNAYELIFLMKGTATYAVQGKEYPLSRYSLILTRPMMVHSIIFDKHTEYERYNILLDEKILSNNILQLLPETLDVLHFDANSVVTDLFGKFDYYCRNLSDTHLNTVLNHLIEEILLNILITMHKNYEQNQRATNSLVKQALWYIDQRLSIPVTVNDVCKELHISQSYLLQLFSKHLNISPQKYIMTKRLTMAQTAIRSGVKPAEVYKQCGFSDYASFFRGYTRYFGHAPSRELEYPLSL